MKSKSPRKPEQARNAYLDAAVQALDDKKAEQITVLDLEERSSVARYFVIASATSQTHLGALRKSLETVWRDRFGQKLLSEARQNSAWQVVDANDILIHLFTPEERARYNLEGLWGDAKQLRFKLSA